MMSCDCLSRTIRMCPAEEMSQVGHTDVILWFCQGSFQGRAAVDNTMCFLASIVHALLISS